MAPPLDIESLHDDIRQSLPHDPLLSPLLTGPMNDQESEWFVSEDSLVHYLGRIFMPETSNLRLRVLKYKHNYILVGHFGQEKT